ncbi:MAG: NTP transferase domain-containing protein [Betaproteobacteria bacterium]
MNVGAVLLAAGAASRMGGRPKCLLQLDGVPLVLRQLDALSAAGVQDIVVMLGHYAEQIESVLPTQGLVRVRNPAPDDGQASSVRLGLQALPASVDAVIVALADQPLITSQDVTALLNAFYQRGEKSMLVPRVKLSDGTSVPGNPVILSAALRQLWLAGEDDRMCRSWRQQHPDQIAWMNTENRHYATDLDTPEDLQQFERDTGQVLRWPSTTTIFTDPG